MKTKKLTKTQMRVVIAKDALAQLRLKKYNAQRGIYIDYDLLNTLSKEYTKDYDDKSAQPFLKNLNNCEVCAKGALFLSTVRKFNDVTLREFRDASEEKACTIFGQSMLDRIESAFEVRRDKDSNNNIINNKFNKFIEKYPDNTIRLEKILLNIIRNKGYFKP